MNMLHAKLAKLMDGKMMPREKLALPTLLVLAHTDRHCNSHTHACKQGLHHATPLLITPTCPSLLRMSRIPPAVE